MYKGPPTDYASALAVAAADLGTDYTDDSAGASIAAEGTAEMVADVEATFDAGTALTSIEFRFECSNDGGTTWRAVAARFAEDQLPGAEVSIAAAAGTTVKRKILTDAHASSKLTRLASKATGVAAGDDAAGCSLLRLVP